MNEDQRDRLILAHLKAGVKTHAEIGREVGIYTAYVSSIAKIAGFSGPINKARRRNKTDQIKRLLAERNVSIGKIEHIVGVSPQYSAIIQNGGANLTLPNSPLAKRILKKIMKSKGKKSSYQIAEECKTSQPYVSRVAKAYGLRCKNVRPKNSIKTIQLPTGSQNMGQMSNWDYGDILW